ncbi:kazal-type serine protease inhibitor domain-containing protein 1-like [Protopterus annectens]|uniref:kazal-type serine protease inhibitor domain-containing protein 1-like n=1 Tax=Protopterus annectens TaxID=7888 RepID=UPI001CF9CFE7|nr:kazal-type serine protease inhibitor domain-containing protein 1-like [Protopterus annectens]
MMCLVYVTVFIAIGSATPRFHHKGWLRLLKEGEGCGRCNRDFCRKLTHCPAGVVLDECNCCPECGNVEGQICDLDNSTYFYGRCGKNLVCRLDTEGVGSRQVPEPQCACRFPNSVCGSDGKTYDNICRFMELQARSKRKAAVKHKGPCASAPIISLAPRDVQNFTGNDIIFGCEVFAYPIPNLDWKKEGRKAYLPGDDAHISVQTRGGPHKYGLTGWLQIQSVKETDEGTYTCYTKNKFGTVFASAKLTVIKQDSKSAKAVITNQIGSFITDNEDYDDDTEDGDDEYEDEEYASSD